MKSIAITHRGCERFCAEEIKEIIPGAKNLKQEETAVIFEADAEDVLKFCYMSQSAIHIFELLSKVKSTLAIKNNDLAKSLFLEL